AVNPSRTFRTICSRKYAEVGLFNGFVLTLIARFFYYMSITEMAESCTKALLEIINESHSDDEGITRIEAELIVGESLGAPRISKFIRLI
ncbi:MAG: hypothetical protein AAGB46_07465, partial [Verrucomicrobiota bacterium]